MQSYETYYNATAGKSFAVFRISIGTKSPYCGSQLITQQDRNSKASGNRLLRSLIIFRRCSRAMSLCLNRSINERCNEGCKYLNWRWLSERFKCHFWWRVSRGDRCYVGPEWVLQFMSGCIQPDCWWHVSQELHLERSVRGLALFNEVSLWVPDCLFSSLLVGLCFPVLHVLSLTRAGLKQVAGAPYAHKWKRA